MKPLRLTIDEFGPYTEQQTIDFGTLEASGLFLIHGRTGSGKSSIMDAICFALYGATWTAPGTYEIAPTARRFETWEGYVAGKIGLGVAVDYAMEVGLGAIFARLQPLAETLRTRLTAIPRVTVHDQGRVRCGITTFSSDAMDAAALQQHLRARGINVSVSTPTSTRIDAEARQLLDLVRASVHYYNTEDEIDRFCAAVDQILHENG